jgi:hypothetical protein
MIYEPDMNKFPLDILLFFTSFSFNFLIIWAVGFMYQFTKLPHKFSIQNKYNISNYIMFDFEYFISSHFSTTSS